MQTYYTSGFLYRKCPIQKMGEQLKHAEPLHALAALRSHTLNRKLSIQEPTCIICWY